MRISFRSCLFKLLLRITLRQYFKLAIGFKNVQILGRALDSLIPVMHGLKIKHISCKGIKVRKLTTRLSCPQKVAFYLHGGGFCLHMPNYYSNFCGNWLCNSGFTVYLPDYSLGPDYHLPVPYNEVMVVYTEISSKLSEHSKILFAGDSAGGALVLGMLQRLVNKHLRLPECAVMISPAVDTSFSFPSARSPDVADPLFPRRALHLFQKEVYPYEDLKNPEISPLYGSFNALPPIYICSGSAELLRDGSRIITQKIKQNQGEVIYSEWPDMFHVYPIFSFLPESKKTLQAISSFIKKYI